MTFGAIFRKMTSANYFPGSAFKIEQSKQFHPSRWPRRTLGADQRRGLNLHPGRPPQPPDDQDRSHDRRQGVQDQETGEQHLQRHRQTGSISDET